MIGLDHEVRNLAVQGVAVADDPFQARLRVRGLQQRPVPIPARPPDQDLERGAREFLRDLLGR